MQSYVPAWKRLGLKLKSAKDREQDDGFGTARSEFVNLKKRKDDDEISNEHANKRLKSSEDGCLDSNGVLRPAMELDRQNGGDFDRDRMTPKKADERPRKPHNHIRYLSEGTSQPVPNEYEDDPTQQASLRKSVKFTPGTKKDDGFSALTISRAWNADEAQATTETTPSRQPQSSTIKTIQTPSKPKKAPKQSPSKPKSATESNTEAEPAYVRYLKQFHTDRDNWKFRKNDQTDLLKNLFNIQQLPSELTPAIVQYIAGLRGATARQRVVDQSESILQSIWESENTDADPETMSLESPRARREAYLSALERYVQIHEASDAGRTEYGDQQLEKIRKGQRAEAILGEALGNFLYPPAAEKDSREPVPFSSGSTATPSRSSETNKRQRKRKSRTEVSSSSSSSSNSSESDSSSSSELTSSSKDSGSDSDSESESESDDDHSSTSLGPTTVSEALKIPQKSRKPTNRKSHDVVPPKKKNKVTQ